VKGANYLCRTRMREPSTRRASSRATNIPCAASKPGGGTATGDRADLSFFPEEQLWSVSAPNPRLLGLRCSDRELCFVSAPGAMLDAQVIVANHHLFADLAARMNGAGYEATAVLPAFRALVLDEATPSNRAQPFLFRRADALLGQQAPLALTRRAAIELRLVPAPRIARFPAEASRSCGRDSRPRRAMEDLDNKASASSRCRRRWRAASGAQASGGAQLQAHREDSCLQDFLSRRWPPGARSHRCANS